MADSRVRDLTEGSPLRLILGFAAPLLFGFLLQQLYSFVDTAIVGRFLGAEALAAVGATGSLNFMILGFCMGLCAGFSIPIAQCFGARSYSELRRYVWNAAWLSILLSVALALVTGLLCPVFLRWMNTPAEIMDMSVSYIRCILFGIPVTLLYNMTSGVLRSIGDSKTPVIFLGLAAAVNIVLDIVCIVVLKLGVFGAAVATVISQLASGIGCLLVMIRHFPILHGDPEERRFMPLFARKLLGMGVPMGLQYSVTAIGTIVMQTAVNALGTAAVAAVAAAMKPFQLFATVYDALASTMATFAGQNMGAGKLKRIDEGLKCTAMIGSVYMIFALAVIIFFGRNILGLFLTADNAHVIDLAYQYIVTSTSFHLLLLFVNIVRFTIQGMGFTSVAIIAGICEMIARSIVGFVLVPVFGFTAACFADPAAWICADAFLIPCYYVVRRKTARRLEGRAEKREDAAAPSR